MGKKKKKVTKKLLKEQNLLKAYNDPAEPGSLGEVGRFACQHRLSYKETQKILQKDLSYTLHKPRRLGRFATLPVLVFGIDDQSVADLVEVQTLAKYKGNRYLLTVIDVLSKYAWVEPCKSKTGVAVTEAFGKF